MEGSHSFYILALVVCCVFSGNDYFILQVIWFGGDQNNPNLQKLLAIWNNHCQKKQSILPMLKYKKNESLPQPGNYKTTDVREHTCNPN